MVPDMTIRRMDNVGIVVDDLAAAIAFFVELGLELEGEPLVEGRWVDRVIGLDGARVDVAMMRTPDGHSRLELMKFHRPTATTSEPSNAPANPDEWLRRPTRAWSGRTRRVPRSGWHMISALATQAPTIRQRYSIASSTCKLERPDTCFRSPG